MNIMNTTSSTYQFSDAQTFFETIIEDKFLRKELLNAAIVIEKLIKEGRDINKPLLSKRPWGLEIDIEMSQPKENKPIIFKFTYSINRVKFHKWIEEHKYMINNPCLIFTDRGIQMFIMPDNPESTSFTKITIVHGTDNTQEKSYNYNITNKPLQFIVHREVLSNHDWIVQCIIE